jgi:hypothetical protein
LLYGVVKIYCGWEGFVENGKKIVVVEIGKKIWWWAW